MGFTPNDLIYTQNGCHGDYDDDDDDVGVTFVCFVWAVRRKLPVDFHTTSSRVNKSEGDFVWKFMVMI